MSTSAEIGLTIFPANKGQPIEIGPALERLATPPPKKAVSEEPSMPSFAAHGKTGKWISSDTG